MLGWCFHLHSPLLHADKPTTLGRRGDLGDVDRDLSRADTNAEPVDDATDDKHGDVLRGSRDGRANDPDHSADHDSFLATKDVRDVTRAERCEPGAGGHRRGDAALNIGARALTRHVSLVEVAEVVLGGNAMALLVMGRGRERSKSSLTLRSWN
jgi:hypothetical protein